MGSGWYRQTLVTALSLVAAVACVVVVLTGSDAVLWVGLAVVALGVVALLVYATPWFEQEWPLDGKDGWLASGGVLTTVGLAVVGAGLVLRLLL
jgi:hypothetical protein